MSDLGLGLLVLIGVRFGTNGVRTPRHCVWMKWIARRALGLPW